jgi:hypothetical protein
MGQQFAGLLLALIGFCIAPLPFVLFKYGARIRASSHYASLNTGAKKSSENDVKTTEGNEKVQLPPDVDVEQTTGSGGIDTHANNGEQEEVRARHNAAEAKGQMAV